MAIQVRRGNEADFDANKMLPGEWAVSLDTKYVRMCFAPGVVLRMASYESFEADMELIQVILEECEEIQTAIERIKSEIDEKASLTIEYSNSASLSATRASEEADRAHEEAERAKNYADSAQSATNVQIATKDTAGIIKGGDNYIAEDGTLTLIVETTETTMPNSHEGRLLFKEIRGKTEQSANPSPTNPQEIKSVAISGITTMNKNIFNPSWLPTETNNGVTLTNNGNNTWTFSGELTDSSLSFGFLKNFTAQTTPVQFKKAGYYKLSTTGINLDSSENQIVYLNLHFNGNTLYNVLRSDYQTVMRLSEEMLSYEDFRVDSIGFWFSGTKILKNGTVGIQIEYIENATDLATDFVPHKESIVTFSKPIEPNGIGDVQDVIKDGKVERQFAKVVFDGSEIWGMSGSVSGRMYGNVWSTNGTRNFLSNMCYQVENYPTEIVGQAFIGNDGNINVLTEFSSVEEWKSHLANNPMTVIYKLATPTTEDIPTSDQVALNSVNTFDGTTYLEFDSPLQPTFVAEYGTSKDGGYTLESLLTARNNDLRLSSLEASVVNNI